MLSTTQLYQLILNLFVYNQIFQPTGKEPNTYLYSEKYTIGQSMV